VNPKSGQPEIAASEDHSLQQRIYHLRHLVDLAGRRGDHADRGGRMMRDAPARQVLLALLNLLTGTFMSWVEKSICT
jgi:hypothetical protein